MPQPSVGSPLARLEDHRLLTGGGRFLDDLAVEAAQAAFLRSPHAHARITAIDVSRARAHPGVLDVVTAEDPDPAIQRPLPVNYPHPALHAPRTPSPLVTEACYVGQPLAMVVATDRRVAEDAVALIDVSYEPLPCAIDLEETAAGRQGPAHEGAEDSIASVYRDECGDVDAAFAAADHDFELRVVCERASGSPLEGRGVLADYDRDLGRLTLIDSTQVPLSVRLLLAQALDIDLDQIDVRAPDIGGGFGTKGFRLYPEEVLVALAARRLGQPVKWVEDRHEHLIAAAHQRSQVHHVRVGCDADGRIVALDVRFLHDMGAYSQFGLLIPIVGGAGIVGPYRIANARIQCTAVYTNTVQVSPYRGSSTPFSTFVMERTIDHIARRLGLDRAEVRLRNVIAPDAFPYDTGLLGPFGPHTTVYDSGQYGAGLRQVLEAIDWHGFPALKQQAAQAGRRLGIGVAAYVEGSGLGPYESARLTVNPSGTITVAVGAASSGQGHETVFAQVAGDVLGIDPSRVRVIGADSRLTPYGFGTFASRSAVVAGHAVLAAAQAISRRARELAAGPLGASVDDLVLADGFVRHADDPGRALPLAAVAAMAAFMPPPHGQAPGLSALETYAPAAATFASGAHACIVEVDPDTYDMRIVRYVAQHDCGNVINPIIVEGQLHGGVAHGIGETFYERRGFDADGQPTAHDFHDYLMPYATEIPRIELVHGHTPAPGNAMGTKGMGEAGIIPVASVLISALEDALGVPLDRTPQSPATLFAAAGLAAAGAVDRL